MPFDKIGAYFDWSRSENESKIGIVLTLLNLKSNQARIHVILIGLRTPAGISIAVYAPGN